MEKSDVVIIGAGAAGLAAAVGLHEMDFQVRVLEARDRIGGRIWTRREQGNQAPVELGAEFVHGKPASTFRLLSSAGIDVIQTTGKRLLYDGKELRPNPEFWEVIEKVNSQIGPDIAYSQFLEGATASPSEKQIARAYVEGFNAARAELISAQGILVADRAAAEIEGDKQFLVPAGYDSIINWMASKLPNDCVHLKTEVRRIQWKRGQVEIGTASEPCAFSAARVLVTVPLGVLRAAPNQRGAIVFDPPIAEKFAAAGHLEMGHAIRLTCRFKEPFWEAFKPLGFVSAPGAPLPAWWSRESLGSNTLIGWAGGPAAERIHSQTDFARLAIRSLSLMFKLTEERLAALLESVAYHDWSADPYSRGAYSYPGVGGIDAARTLALPLDETLFFAGEATDANGHCGTVHGALSSGERAAREIIGGMQPPSGTVTI